MVDKVDLSVDEMIEINEVLVSTFIHKAKATIKKDKKFSYFKMARALLDKNIELLQKAGGK